MPSGDFRTTYREDRAIFATAWTRWMVAGFVILLLCLPVLTGRYVLYIFTLAGVNLIAATGLNILTGNTGQISLGQAGLMAVGAYATAITSTHLAVPFPLMVALSGVVAAAFGLVVAIPSLRLKGLYLALSTIAFQLIVEFAIYRGGQITGGATGLAVPVPALLGVPLDTDGRYYLAVLGAAIGLLAFARNLLRSRVGRAFMAIRDRDIAAEIAGIDVTRYKIVAFAISSFYGGVAGSLLAYHVRYISPENFTLFYSISLLGMVIIGGLGSVLGSVLGTVFMTLLPEAIRLLVGALNEALPVLSVRFALLQDGIFGLSIVLFLLFEPEGLVGGWRSLKTYWRTWPYAY